MSSRQGTARAGGEAESRGEGRYPPGIVPAGERHSGRLLLRMPQTLHAELAKAAEREGTSLNQFITRSLAGAIGWQGAGSAPERRSGSRRADLTTVVLIVNAVVVGLAAVAAIAILLVALG